MLWEERCGSALRDLRTLDSVNVGKALAEAHESYGLRTAHLLPCTWPLHHSHASST